MTYYQGLQQLHPTLDTTSAPDLEAHIGDNCSPGEKKDIAVDMSKCEFVSSAGLRVIVAMQKNASATQGTLVFTGIQPEVMDVFEMTGFNKILTLEAASA